MKKKMFTKDFTLVVIGQIISLFGNAAVRFALPLYLLNLKVRLHFMEQSQHVHLFHLFSYLL